MRNLKKILNSANEVVEASLWAGILAFSLLLIGCDSTSKKPFYEQYPSQKVIQLEHRIEDSKIEEAREAYAQIDEIKGAIYDEEINWPIIFGSIKNIEKDSQEKLDNESLMNFDELIMCIKVVQEGYDPGVSIEPPAFAYTGSMPSYQTIRYIPKSIKGTWLGKKVFEADRALKGLCFARDPITDKRVSCKVYGYKTLPELAREDEDLKVGYFGRIWFKPKEVLLKKGEDIILFDTITIKVESESPYPAPSEFASHLEKHYKAFGEELPIYKDLVRIGKEVAIGRWLAKDGHGLDLKDYKMQSVYAPSKTNTLTGTVRETYYGGYIERQVLVGGVIYNTRNRYDNSPSLKDINLILNVRVNKNLKNIKNLMLSARPNKTDISWNFGIAERKYMALALPFRIKKLPPRQLMQFVPQYLRPRVVTPDMTRPFYEYPKSNEDLIKYYQRRGLLKYFRKK